MTAINEAHRTLLSQAAEAIPGRVHDAQMMSGHRALGRVVRDAVALLMTVDRLGADDPDGPASSAFKTWLPTATFSSIDAASTVRAIRRALDALHERQRPSGTFQGGDNLDSPPDSAFTINDLAWARRASSLAGASQVHLLDAVGAPLDRLLEAAAPALINGGVHTPNHRWEISSALAQLWEIHGDPATRERAEQWLSEGIDLQPDGLFSERSPNYAARVSVPSLLTLGRILDRPDLIAGADVGVRRQADLTGPDGFIETLASRRQDQFAAFPGGPLFPLFRAHSARTGDPITARASMRTAWHASADDLLTMLVLGIDDPATLGPPAAPADPATPTAPELVELQNSGLVSVDHGESSAVLFGGTDTSELARIASGSSSQSTFARFRGTRIGVRDLRLSRNFFSMGPFRPDPPKRATDASSDLTRMQFTLHERVQAEYYHPLDPGDRHEDGAYSLGFNGRFVSPMDFERRRTDVIALDTRAAVVLEPGSFDVSFSFDGPEHAICLLLALHGGEFQGTRLDERGRNLLIGGPRLAECSYAGQGERLVISVSGSLGGHGFYDPGEAYTFLGATDEPAGDVLLIPASSAQTLRLQLRLSSEPAP